MSSLVDFHFSTKNQFLEESSGSVSVRILVRPSTLMIMFRSLPEPWHAPLLPALRPHNKLLLRTVILIRKKTNNRMNVLVSEKTEAHLPVCDINPMRSIHSTLKKFLTEIFGADIPQHKVIYFSFIFRHHLLKYSF